VTTDRTAPEAPGEGSPESGPNFGCALAFFVIVAALGAVATPRLYTGGFFGRAPEVALTVAPFEATGGVGGEEVPLRSDFVVAVGSATGVEIIPWGGGDPVGAELAVRGTLGPAPAGTPGPHRLHLRLERWPAGTVVWEGAVTGDAARSMAGRAGEVLVRVLRTAR